MPKKKTENSPIQKLCEFNVKLYHQVLDWTEKNPASFRIALSDADSLDDCNGAQILAICLLTIQQGLKTAR